MDSLKPKLTVSFKNAFTNKKIKLNSKSSNLSLAFKMSKKTKNNFANYQSLGKLSQGDCNNKNAQYKSNENYNYADESKCNRMDNIDNKRSASNQCDKTTNSSKSKESSDKNGIVKEILLIVTFLDSLCFGLIFPLLTPRLFKIGGNHTIAGCFISLQIISKIVSITFVKAFIIRKFGLKNSLEKTLLISLALFYLLAVTTSCFKFTLVFCIYCLTNHTLSICNEILNTTTTSKEENSKSLINLQIANVGGFVLGSISGGYFVEWCGFSKVCYFSCLITFAAIVFLKSKRASKAMKIIKMGKGDDISSISKEEKSNIKRKRNIFEDFVQQTYEYVSELKNIETIKVSHHFFLLLSYILFTISTTVFFTKFPLLLLSHYKASSAKIGFTVAYQRILIFTSNHINPFLKSSFNLKKINKIINIFFILNISFIGLCYAPSYEIYLLFLIPMIVAKTACDNFWDNPNVYPEKIRAPFTNIFRAAGKTSEITISFVFGYFCDLYSDVAMQIFILLPLLTLLLVLPFSDKAIMDHIIQRDDDDEDSTLKKTK